MSERWKCGTCGYDGLTTEFRGTIDFSVLVFCPGCAGEMHRPGVLSEIDGSVASLLRYDDFLESIEGAGGS